MAELQRQGELRGEPDLPAELTEIFRSMLHQIEAGVKLGERMARRGRRSRYRRKVRFGSGR